MKPVFVLSHINKSLQWLWYSQELQKRGIEHFYIIINEEYPILAKDLEKQNIKVYFLKHRNSFSHLVNYFKVCSLMIKHKPSIVHTSLPYGNLIGQLSAFSVFNKNRITTCENASWAHDFHSSKQKFIDKLTFRFSKKIITTCEVGRDYLKENWNIKEEKLVTILQALKPEEYDVNSKQIQVLKTELKIKDDEFVIGMVARFEYWKGHIYAIEAINMLKVKYPKIRLLIFGSKGPEYKKIMEKIKEYKLEEQVMYKGFINDIPSLFKLLNIHLHVPINKNVETFGLNIIEGMISKCPQILTRSGIAYTTAQHMKNCLIVDYCNSQSIADAIELLIKEPELGNQLAEEAHKDALNLFSLSKKTDVSLALYKSVSE